jgi:hypothetical protein
MSSFFDLHGYVTVSVESGAPAERQLREMFRPFLVDHLDGPADIVVGEPGPPLSRASHGEHAFRFTDESVDVVADRVRVTVRPDGYEVRGKGELLTSVLPIVERVGVERGAAMVHAATIAIGDAGVCLPAWGGVGKTSTVARLTSLPEGRFMGDDWAWVDKNQQLLGYAKPMFLKPHHRELYPHVFGANSKPLAPSAMTDTVARLATAVHPVIIRYPRLADVTRRWSPEHMMAHPEDVFPPEKIATRVPLRLCCFVERYDGDDLELTERSTGLDGPPDARQLPLRAPAHVAGADHGSWCDRADRSRRLLRRQGAVLEESVAGVPAYSLRVPADWSAPRASTAIADQVLELLRPMNRPVPADAPQDVAATRTAGAATATVPGHGGGPVRDGADFADECLDSVLANGPDEVIVVDGGSSDGTLDAARRRGLRVVTHEGSGPASARMAGAALARNDVVVLIDVDVVLPDGALARWYDEFRVR